MDIDRTVYRGKDKGGRGEGGRWEGGRNDTAHMPCGRWDMYGPVIRTYVPMLSYGDGEDMGTPQQRGPVHTTIIHVRVVGCESQKVIRRACSGDSAGTSWKTCNTVVSEEVK